ncbi:MAG: single-stranded DNA-binding protein [Actinomycetota bacterium]|nr:single-stranded DNA-binding protein [Actinomycetota bacterium]
MPSGCSHALPSGADVARLRVATTTRRRAGEEWVDKTNYFTVEVFGAQARNCAQYLSRGSRVFVDAELEWREWTDPQDTKREAVTFKARNVLFEGARARNGTAADDSGPAQPAPAPDPPRVATPTPTLAPAPASYAAPASHDTGTATAEDDKAIHTHTHHHPCKRQPSCRSDH